MKKNIFLTSAFAMGFVLPAMAETFPSNGYMQENKTYDNAATSTNMDGVYSGTVNAVAEYTDILYNIVAGNYLAAGSDATNGTQCPAGSWCPGLTNALYNENADQGINSCSTATDGIYALSAAGSDSQNDCYRTCTTADVEHSAGVTGGYYYGDNNQCGATDCENGWHLKSGISSSELATAIGTGTGAGASINNNGSFSEDSKVVVHQEQSYYGISDNNTWVVDYGSSKGMLIGQARCSTRGVANKWSYNNNTFESDHFVSSLTDETGQEGASNCYCNVTGYTPNGGTLQAVLSPWVFYNSYNSYNSASNCADSCARACVSGMNNSDPTNLAFRAALVGSATGTGGLASCEANTITINWSDASAADISANNAGTATYGSDVRTPVKAATKKGKTFRGWRFSAPEQTTTGNNG